MSIESKASSNEFSNLVDFVVDQIRAVVARDLDQVVTLETSLYELGLDSLASMTIVNRIEESLGVRFSEQSLYDIQTCGDLVEIVQESISQQASGSST